MRSPFTFAATRRNSPQLAAVLLTLVMGCDPSWRENRAEAGGCARTYQTLKSYGGWNHGCYACHKTQQQSKGLSGLDEARRWMFSIAKQRDESRIIQEEAKALGLSGYVAQSGYGGYGVSSYTEQSLTYPSAQSGATLFGYGVVQPQALDKMALLNLSARLTTNAQDLAGQGLAGVQSLMETAVQGDTATAQILARGQAAAAALAASVQPATTQETKREFKFQVSQTPEGKVTVQALDANAALFDEARFAAVVQQQCAACHTAITEGGPKGGLNVRELMTLPAERWETVLARIYSTDVETRMPKDHPPLSLEEKALFSRASEEALRNPQRRSP